MCNTHTPGHPSAADEAWYWPKRVLCIGCTYHSVCAVFLIRPCVSPPPPPHTHTHTHAFPSWCGLDTTYMHVQSASKNPPIPNSIPLSPVCNENLPPKQSLPFPRAVSFRVAPPLSLSLSLSLCLCTQFHCHSVLFVLIILKTTFKEMAST